VKRPIESNSIAFSAFFCYHGSSPHSGERCRSGCQLEANPPSAETGTPGKRVCLKGYRGFCAVGASASGGESLHELQMTQVYVLWSESPRKRYAGSAVDAVKRLGEHNAGRSRFTKGGCPWILIHIEDCPDLSSARRREAFLKSGAGRAWLDIRYPQYARRNK
jgi:putative endonuclease